jgi:type VI secretion system secreted protein Hcp
MADYFLQITGIAGESKEAKHKDWIDVLSWSFGETNAGTGATGGGAGAGKVQMSDFSFMKATSKASPKLFLACAQGQRMKEAKLSAVKSGAMQQEYLSWTFSDVLISSYQTTGSSGDDVSMDSVSLAFSKVQVEYKAQKADGSLEAPVVAGWDVQASKKV